jgi:DNA-binding transcriptional ArsR family regulator
LSDQLSGVFAALADPTRREMVNRLLSDGTTSVPALTAMLPISRQAVAKHLAALDEAGLVQRSAGEGRTVSWRLRPGALAGASAWLAEADAAWDGRLRRLKRTVERPSG